MSCHNEYACEIWNPCLSRFMSYCQGQSLWKVCQTSRSTSLGQKLCMMWKVLSQRINMWNMKALSLMVHKLWPIARLKFLKSRSNFKVKVTRLNIMAWCERSCHTEYTCEIWKRCLSWFISYDQGKSFRKVGQTSRSRSFGQKLCNYVKCLVTRNIHVQYESPSSSCLKVLANVKVLFWEEGLSLRSPGKKL